MKGIEPGLLAGEWRLEQEIGKGAFGIVTAWKNEITHHKLVVKQCRQKLDPKSHSRWVEEISLMNSMRHNNLVSGRKIPQEIKNAINDPEDLLGLEFCDNDLRKVLSNPSHCCGLKEKAVLDILRDVSSGMRFLHEQQHIIHRDLKPENILLSHKGNETVYKITDLGYAKRIDNNSLCMSFVGTLQYLAPELYDHVLGYTYTADYWSFGTVIFECISGIRPFLLTENVFDWYTCMKTKKDTEIWGSYDETYGTRFFTELPSPNQLCEPVLFAFKNWLQLVLKQDPHERGRNDNGGSVCFSRAESILQLKIIHVFDMLTCKDIAYDYQCGDIGSKLKFFLENVLNYKKDEQLLVFAASGNILDDGELLEQCYLQRDTIYLFNTNKCAEYSADIPMPALVHEIANSRDKFQNDTKLKIYCAHALFYCKTVAYAYKSLLRGQRALIINMISKNRSLHCLKDELTKASIRLQTVIEVYEKSSDITFCEDQNNLDEESMNDWNGFTREIQGYVKCTDIVNYLKDIHSMQEKCSTLLKSPIVKMQQSETELDRLTNQAEECYTHAKDKETDLVDSIQNSKRISNIVLNGIRSKENMFKAFYSHLSGVMHTYNDIGDLNSSIERKISNLKSKYSMILQHQLHRQRVLWKKVCAKEASRTFSYRSSNLLSSLEGELLQNIKDGSADKIVNDVTNSFDRLGQLINDEGEADIPQPMSFPYVTSSSHCTKKDYSLDVNLLKKIENLSSVSSNESEESFYLPSVNSDNSFNLQNSLREKTVHPTQAYLRPIKDEFNQYQSESVSRYARNTAIYPGTSIPWEAKLGNPPPHPSLQGLRPVASQQQNSYNLNQLMKSKLFSTPPASRVEQSTSVQPQHYLCTTPSSSQHQSLYPTETPGRCVDSSSTNKLYSQLPKQPGPFGICVSSTNRNVNSHVDTMHDRLNHEVYLQRQQRKNNEGGQNIIVRHNSVSHFLPHHPSTYSPNAVNNHGGSKPLLNSHITQSDNQHARYNSYGKYSKDPNILSYNVRVPAPHNTPLAQQQDNTQMLSHAYKLNTNPAIRFY